MLPFDKNTAVYTAKQFTKEFNLDSCVFELLESIEKDNKEIKDTLIAKYLKLPFSADAETKLLEYFINNSVFSTATMANPATSIVTELLYKRPNILYPIDKYFLASRSGKAIYSRINCVEENILKLTEEFLKKNKKVLIGNVGGGPSRDIINIFSKHYKDNENIKAVSVDRDKFTIKRGRLLAKIAGVDDMIEFAEANFMRYKPKKKFDIILLVGVLCGLSPKTCVAVLKTVKKMLAKGGRIVASNVTPKMLDEDPFTYLVMNDILNWSLIFKDEDTLKEIF
jgi:hypothetical protein